MSFPAEQNGLYELVQDTGKPVFASVAPTIALSYRKLPNIASLDRCCAIIGSVLLVAEAFLVRLGQDILASCLGSIGLGAIGSHLLHAERGKEYARPRACVWPGGVGGGMKAR